MPSYNKCLLIGNMCRDVELRYTQNNTAVTDITLAVNDKKKNPSGEWVEETTFVDVTLWGRTAEVCNEYCGKGSPVMIEGRLKLDTWESKEGEKRSKLKVVGERLQMLSTKGGSPKQDSYSEPVNIKEELREQVEALDGVDDDVPFSWAIMLFPLAGGMIHAFQNML